ncbi:MAG: bifunctional phosphopantothenoylcysteine decarboxylase/phosphopantothenate--cysteine ligase CoaBC [Desulfobacterales bacterium]|nr:bifunctional phosphopantothenoylcysteine decarboxylase/phosphopantothenate--cysteine ligase CoaBC [Desulfobacterales bacterium]
MSLKLVGKRIVLGVCGGIAVYKSIELLRILVKEGANVRVIMTKNAKEFIGSLIFEALSGNSVLLDLFEDKHGGTIKHIDWARQADIVIVAPATANFIGKMVNGIGDDALTTFIMAVTSPTIICPSMNTYMYQSKAVQRNLNGLKKDGYYIVEPEVGELACGTKGTGRLPEPEVIFDKLISYISKKDLKDKKIIITAGPTHENIDPVRFISNPSSGKMGFAIAKSAERRGANVDLISGPTNLSSPIGVNVIKITSAVEMADKVFSCSDHADIIIKTAAVSDYRPKNQAFQKIKKDIDEISITLIKNIDILQELGKRKKNKQILVGFAAETENLDQYAQKKLMDKNLDMIVGNLIGASNAGFGSDSNKVTLFFSNGLKEILPEMSKDDLANIILDRIVTIKN